MLFDGAVGATADTGIEAATASDTQNFPEPAAPPVELAIEIKADPAPVNRAPIANDDSRVADHDSGPLTGNIITGAAPGDVADSDPDGDAFAVFGIVAGNQTEVPVGHVGSPVAGEHGSLVLHADGSYTYTPGPSVANLQPGESVQDVFSCLVCDDVGNIDTSTLTFTFNNVDSVAPGPEPVPAPGPAPAGPPVEVAPPTPQPVLPVPQPPGGSTDQTVLPLPPTSTNQGEDSGDPFAGRDSDGIVTTQSAPFTLLSAESGAPTSVETGNVFAPFAPAAVLGMVETSPDRDAKLAKVPVVTSADDTSAPKAKPNVVTRAAVIPDGESAKPSAVRFTEKIKDSAKRGAPVMKPKATNGADS